MQSMTQCLFAEESSLLTLPNLTERVVRNLNDMGITALRELVGRPRDEVVGVLRKCGVVSAHATAAQQLLQQLPAIRLSAAIPGEGGKGKGGGGGGGGKGSVVEMEAGAEGELVMRIEQANRGKRGGAAYVPKSNNLPSKTRDEGWWAVVGCRETDELLALKRLSIRRQVTHILKSTRYSAFTQRMQ